MITTELSVKTERPRDKVCPVCARKYHYSFTGDYCPVDMAKLELENL